jgi:hypothetical protein
MVGIRDHWHSVEFSYGRIRVWFHTAEEWILRTEGLTWDKLPSFRGGRMDSMINLLAMFLFLQRFPERDFDVVRFDWTSPLGLFC